MKAAALCLHLVLGCAVLLVFAAAPNADVSSRAGGILALEGALLLAIYRGSRSGWAFLLLFDAFVLGSVLLSGAAESPAVWVLIGAALIRMLVLLLPVVRPARVQVRERRSRRALPRKT